MTNINKDELLKKIYEIGITNKHHENTSKNALKLSEFENNRGIKLPDDFKKFLLVYGNMSLKEEYYYKPLEKNSWTPVDGFETVDFFYGFSDDNYDLSIIYEKLMEQLLESYIPIAEMSGGNILCLCVKGDDYGKIYFGDHEIRGAKEYYLSANSFTELIMGFTVHKRIKDVDLSKIKITLSDDLL